MSQHPAAPSAPPCPGQPSPVIFVDRTPHSDRAVPPEAAVRAESRAQRIPGSEAVRAAWAAIPVDLQAVIGAKALAAAFYGWLATDGQQPAAERWITEAACDECEQEATAALNRLYEFAAANAPSLYGTAQAEPLWSQEPGQ